MPLLRSLDFVEPRRRLVGHHQRALVQHLREVGALQDGGDVELLSPGVFALHEELVAALLVAEPPSAVVGSPRGKFDSIDIL